MAVASILNVLVLIYKSLICVKSCKQCSSAVHMAVCFFPVADMKLLGMPLKFSGVKASLCSGILQLAHTVFS